MPRQLHGKDGSEMSMLGADLGNSHANELALPHAANSHNCEI